MPVPLTSILELNVDDFSNLLTICNPSLILLVPPVKITIFEPFLLIYVMFDKILSLYSINPIKKYVKKHQNKTIEDYGLTKKQILNDFDFVYQEYFV